LRALGGYWFWMPWIFHALMDRQPSLAARIEEAAREKLGHDLNAPDGDLVTEELDNASSD
jgi:hypothetical protein